MMYLVLVQDRDYSELFLLYDQRYCEDMDKVLCPQSVHHIP